MRIGLVAFLLLSACGAPEVNLEGDWAGTWTANLGHDIQGGALTLAIDGGTVTGSCTNSAIQVACSVIGEVDQAGKATLVYTWPGVATMTAACSAKVVAEHAVGSCDLRAGGTASGTLTFDLTQRPPANGHSASWPDGGSFDGGRR